MLGSSSTCFLQICPFPFEDRHPHVIHCSSGQAHISQMTSRSVRPFLYGSQMLCCNMPCQRGRKSQNCPFPVKFHYAAGGGQSHGRRQNLQKFGKNRMRLRRYPRGQTDTHRHTHTHHNTSQINKFTRIHLACISRKQCLRTMHRNCSVTYLLKRLMGITKW